MNPQGSSYSQCIEDSFLSMVILEMSRVNNITCFQHGIVNSSSHYKFYVIGGPDIFALVYTVYTRV